MIWNQHSDLVGKHAFLGASKYSWLNKDPQGILTAYENSMVTEQGTVLHELACKLIKNQMRISKNDRKLVLFYLLDHGIPRYMIDVDRVYMNLYTYVSDAISYHLSPEVVLRYSDNCFGTTDAILFDEKEQFLRIHDLKTGTTPAHMEQLEIYAALFCLEYGKDPNKIKVELRIYQNENIMTCNPETDPDLQKNIADIMKKIMEYDELIEKFKDGE